MATVALVALWDAQLRGNPWVAVFGLGPVGNIAAQAFDVRGCRVIGIDPLGARRVLAQQCGIPHVIGGSPEEVQAAIADITAGQLAGISIDAVGHAGVIRQAIGATAPFGQVVLLGTPRVPMQGNITEMWTDVHMRMITVRGALEWSLPAYSAPGGQDSQQSKQEMIFDWIRRGKLLIEPLISHRLQPTQIKAAYEGLLNEPESFFGVLLDWRGGNP
jgi:threonine dehydrogenase-like Zn-dependent dehydrogenase